MAVNVIDRDSLIGVVASPLVWAAHFLICYILVAVACAFGFAMPSSGEWGTVRIVLVAASAVALVIIAVLSVLAHRRWRQSGGNQRPNDERQSRHRFMAVSALLLCILSGVSVLYTAIPVVFLPICQ
jgi:hypothetical protein